MRGWKPGEMTGPTPQWWPDGESWPPGPGPRGGRHAWPGIRQRVMRVVAFAVVMLFVVPIVVALALAGAVGGFDAVVIVVVFWMAILVVALIAGRFVFRSFGPIRQLVETTDRLADGDYSARASTAGAAALQPVVRSVNTMAERLDTSEQLRRRLLADVGHELRTPLTIIRGSLEAIADGVRVLERDQVAALLVDVSVMERLLDDLQTLSAAEAGTLRLHSEPVDLPALLDQAAGAFSGVAAEAGVEIRVEAGSAIAGVEPIEVDPVRLREVMNNLIANALRATGAGGSIVVEARPVEADGSVTITVTDDGVGMTADELAHAFDRFHKGPTSDGSGLGLTISRDLVEAHGGTIDVVSTAGEGTTVTVQLPASPPPL